MTLAATVSLLLAIAMVSTTPHTSVLADPNCSGSIGQATAEARAYDEAELAGFSEATVTTAELLTWDEADWRQPLNFVKPATCLWYVQMDGSMDDTFSGTPTPGAYVEMHVAFNSVTGELDSSGWVRHSVVLTTATITPTYTPTSGPSPTPWRTPTAVGTPSPTPTP